MSTESVARALAALGSPIRLRLLLELATCCTPGGGSGSGGECGDSSCCTPVDAEESCVGRIAEAVHVAPSTVSHHIKELRDAGVIWCLKQGRRVCCGIDAETLAAVRAVVERLDAVSEPRPLARLIGAEAATKQVSTKRAVSVAGPKGKRRSRPVKSAGTKGSVGTNRGRSGSNSGSKLGSKLVRGV